MDSIRELVVGHYPNIHRIKSANLIHKILIHHDARRLPKLPK